ncbi:unnamed protein product, partial [Rotaria sp. Silwood2]
MSIVVVHLNDEGNNKYYPTFRKQALGFSISR